MGHSRTQSDGVPYRVRVLGPGDSDGLESLNAVFAEAFGDSETYLAEPPGREYLESLLGDGCFLALVAEADGAVVGGLTAYELRKAERRRSELYVYDLAIAEDHRRRGIATALFSELRRIARDRGAWVIFVQADYGDDPAIALYTKLGTREDVIHFDIEPE